MDKNMRLAHKNLLLVSILAAIFAAGCSNDSSLTKEQIEGMQHPKADAGYKAGPPSAEVTAKMNKDIADYREKHKNDKVEFKTGGN